MKTGRKSYKTQDTPSPTTWQKTSEHRLCSIGSVLYLLEEHRCCKYIFNTEQCITQPTTLPIAGKFSFYFFILGLFYLPFFYTFAFLFSALFQYFLHLFLFLCPSVFYYMKVLSEESSAKEMKSCFILITLIFISYVKTLNVICILTTVSISCSYLYLVPLVFILPCLYRFSEYGT